MLLPLVLEVLLFFKHAQHLTVLAVHQNLEFFLELFVRLLLPYVRQCRRLATRYFGVVQRSILRLLGQASAVISFGEFALFLRLQGFGGRLTNVVAILLLNAQRLQNLVRVHLPLLYLFNLFVHLPLLLFDFLLHLCSLFEQLLALGLNYFSSSHFFVDFFQ